jgi:hypothetical protein
MSEKSMTYLTLPEEVRRMAGMAAAREGKSLSGYVAEVVLEHCRRSGVAALVSANAGVGNAVAEEDKKEGSQ